MSEVLDRSDEAVASIYEAVCYWAAATPDAPALLAEGRPPVSYRDLHAAIETIGVRLNALGIGRNDRVAVLHPGGTRMAVAVMGVWSRATAAPLNPNYTPGEFAVYLRDLRIKALVIAADMDTPARLVALKLGLPVLDLAAPFDGAAGGITIEGQPTGPAVVADRVTGGDIALLLTTSGTTSQSKIVPIRHCELVARCRNAGHRLELSPADRCLNLMPLYHSHGLNTGLGVSILFGASILPMPQFDVESFFRALDTVVPT